jgi:hypothetical protein
MAPFGRNQDRTSRRQDQALAHPIRIRIMELFTRNADRSLAAGDLTEDLAPGFPELNVSQVAYHLFVLRNAQLIPTGY